MLQSLGWPSISNETRTHEGFICPLMICHTRLPRHHLKSTCVRRGPPIAREGKGRSCSHSLDLMQRGEGRVRFVCEDGCQQWCGSGFWWRRLGTRLRRVSLFGRSEKNGIALTCIRRTHLAREFSHRRRTCPSVWTAFCLRQRIGWEDFELIERVSCELGSNLSWMGMAQWREGPSSGSVEPDRRPWHHANDAIA